MCDRPDYKKLGVLKQQFPDVLIMALTATATQRVCEDLMAMLRIEACESFTASINRPNLQYEVNSQVISSVVSNDPRQIGRPCRNVEGCRAV